MSPRSSDETSDYTPSLNEVINLVVENRLCEVHTCLPGKIGTYDPVTQRADIIIDLLRVYENSPVPQPPILLPDVPILHPRTKLAYVHLPISPGDQVTIFFCERSLDTWKPSGGPVDPIDRRKFSYGDAFAYPGGYPLSFPLTPAIPFNALDLVVGNSIAQIVVQPTGKFKIWNGAIELLELISQTAFNLAQTNQYLSTAVTATLIGPQPLSTAPLHAAIATTVTAIKGFIDVLKGV